MYIKIIIFLLFLSACQNNDLQNICDTHKEQGQISARIQEGKVRVKFKPDFENVHLLKTRASQNSLQIISIRRLFQDAGKFEKRSREAGLHLWYEVTFDKSIPVTKAISSLLDSNSIEHIEPVFRMQSVDKNVEFIPVTPSVTVESAVGKPFNDPYLSKQWHYNNTGELPEFIFGADINLFEAWKQICGSRKVIVAIIDGGVDIAHEDLAGNVGNPAELYGQPGVDDDGNGFIDDCYGWNFVRDISDVTSEEHGTHVAGTIGAENNNYKGVCGVAGGCGSHSGVWLLSCQILEKIGADDYWGNFAQAIKYAADAGAVIAQNSWGYDGISFLPESDKAAIDYFIKYAGTDENGQQTGPIKGGLVVFAGGNEDKDYLSYPACYEKVVAVAAYDSRYKKAWYSNYADWIDISAPGGSTSFVQEMGILSTIPSDKYAYFQGTSMAAPHVSGIAALIVSRFGENGFTLNDLLNHLYKGCRDFYSFNLQYEEKLGIGAADAALALMTDGGFPPEAIDKITYGNTTGRLELKWNISTDKDDGTPIKYLVCWSEYPIENVAPGKLPEKTESIIVPIYRNKKPGDEITCSLTRIKGSTTYYVSIIGIDPWGNCSPATGISFTTSYNTPPAIISQTLDNHMVLKYKEKGKMIFRIEDQENQFFTYDITDPSNLLRSTLSGNEIQVEMINDKIPPGLYTFTLKVMDEGCASTTKQFSFEALPNEKPELVTPFENLWFDSLQEIRTITLQGHFVDEESNKLIYSYEYDANAIEFKSESGKFTIKPLRFGTSRLKIKVKDSGNLTNETEIVLMCHDYREEITLYPNPVKDVLNIRMKRNVNGELLYKVQSLNGEKLRTGRCNISPYNPAQINLSYLSEGIYMINIEYQGKHWSRNIIKQ